MEVVFPGYFIVSPGTAYAEVSNLDQTFITKEGLGTGERGLPPKTEAQLLGGRLFPSASNFGCLQM